MIQASFVLTSLTRRVGRPELDVVAAAIQQQLEYDLFRTWGFRATIHAVDRLEETPQGAAPIIVADHLRAQPGTYGYHLLERNNPNTPDDDQPYAVVQYSNSGAWSLDASHECLEMVINPRGNTVHRAPSLDGTRWVYYLAEICDPCGRASAVHRIDINGTPVAVSNFITRAYYDNPNGTNQPSFAYGNFQVPRSLMPGGYIAWAEQDPFQNFADAQWRMQIAGGTPQQIATPNLNASLREVVDFASHDYVKKQCKASDIRRILKGLPQSGSDVVEKENPRMSKVRRDLNRLAKMSNSRNRRKG